MNLLRSLCLLLILVNFQTVFSQSTSDEKYPNVTLNILENQKLSYFVKHKFTIPGVWGLGFNAQYMLDNIIYVEAEAGYGWIIGDHSEVPDTFKKFRGWFEVRAGYPVISFTGSKKGKWVVSQSGGKDNFYEVNVPARNSLIAMAGFSSEPISLKGGAGSSIQAPVYKLGVKWMSFLKARVSVSDHRGNNHSGSVQRKFEVYAGLVFPAKSEIVSTENIVVAQKSDVLGLEFMFSIPYRLNGWATFDIGMRSLGYNDIGQFYVGNTFYL